MLAMSRPNFAKEFATWLVSWWVCTLNVVACQLKNKRLKIVPHNPLTRSMATNISHDPSPLNLTLLNQNLF